jgi:NADPH2:quinone reductase
MRAVVVTELTEPSRLHVSEIPEPQLTEEGVLVEVKAAGCNFFDTLIVRGKYQVKPPFPFSPGGEIAGVVRAVGARVGGTGIDGIEPGARVAARVGYGGFAERVVVPASALIPISGGMTDVEAAAFPIVYGTAYHAVVTRGRVAPGETVLVTAAAGGVGLASVQVARAAGARVIALASGDKLDVPRSAGADECVDYRAPDWMSRVKELTSGRGVDVVVENVGGDVFEGCLKCLAWGARLVISGFASGSIPQVAANRVMLKHVSIVGLHFGPMSEHEPELVRAGYRRLFEWYDAGSIRPLVSETYPLERVADALTALAARRTVGKIVLTL